MRPYVAYYRPPQGSQVQEFDEVEVMSGEHKGVQGVVATLQSDGDVKIWVDESVVSGSKLWINKPDLKLIVRPS